MFIDRWRVSHEAPAAPGTAGICAARARRVRTQHRRAPVALRADLTGQMRDPNPLLPNRYRVMFDEYVRRSPRSRKGEERVTRVSAW
jgi:hypothetical protein